MQVPTAPRYLPLPHRLGWVLALLALVTTVYLGSNYFPMAAPRALPRTAVDLALGWRAWTIWPYWLLLVLAPVFIVSISDRRILLATLRAYAASMALNAAIWMIWPTHAVRQTLPSDLDPATDAAWRLLYFLDGSNNCFPSGHITAPIVAVAGFCAQHPRARRWAWPAVVVLFPSVVSTGQHYTWDVLGGAATALLALAWVRDQLHAPA
ncbi:phosphatase PAP2 family protein [Agrilutibacter solisilvae]|uniref:Phosphatase PAP2 family protein n=1 Tax=Agrilutibacter solisilvae TaxID=2763317 RepID=A0A974XYX3_9GAMM|nr:phosphatase PAP2 family protein [Lysobacter solisilvae]QSX78326.1 phosphatase PAP2 family protein [Lysobacter solisilvae]